MSTCANCFKTISDRESTKPQCDGCTFFMHLNCTDFKADDRVTRQKLRCIKIVCNRCSSIVDQFGEIKDILETFKINIDKKVDSFDEKLKSIQNNIESFNNQLSEFKDQVKNSESLRSPEFIETVTAEAVDRMRRAKNILIRGIAEAQGDSAVKKEHDKEELDLVLSSDIAVPRCLKQDYNHPTTKALQILVVSKLKTRSSSIFSYKLLSVQLWKPRSQSLYRQEHEEVKVVSLGERFHNPETCPAKEWVHTSRVCSSRRLKRVEAQEEFRDRRRG
ncbi:unnamed protein product [Psylliodes chrysocephalus]|uniref:Uncharacterized protein n=1 Tax=Psylliodes chrysocephalus TaxID=3402493 RepID=A0A9P0D1P8_9CUCU|nr:unnamed protein product [Psylliodes chrysocephala]